MGRGSNLLYFNQPSAGYINFLTAKEFLIDSRLQAIQETVYKQQVFQFKNHKRVATSDDLDNQWMTILNQHTVFNELIQRENNLSSTAILGAVPTSNRFPAVKFKAVNQRRAQIIVANEQFDLPVDIAALASVELANNETNLGWHLDVDKNKLLMIKNYNSKQMATIQGLVIFNAKVGDK